jgi:hypothetical protein
LSVTFHKNLHHMMTLTLMKKYCWENCISPWTWYWSHPTLCKRFQERYSWVMLPNLYNPNHKTLVSFVSPPQVNKKPHHQLLHLTTQHFKYKYKVSNNIPIFWQTTQPSLIPRKKGPNIPSPPKLNGVDNAIGQPLCQVKSMRIKRKFHSIHNKRIELII